MYFFRLLVRIYLYAYIKTATTIYCLIPLNESKYAPTAKNKNTLTKNSLLSSKALKYKIIVIAATTVNINHGFAIILEHSLTNQ